MNIVPYPTLAFAIGVIEIIVILVVLGVMTAIVIVIIAAVVASNRKKSLDVTPIPPRPPAVPLSVTVQLCPKCGRTLETNAPQGLCPSCLMKGAFTTAPGTDSGFADKNPPLPEDLATHFPQLEILELLGQGGMGMVYKARQTQLDRFVALKLLPVRASGDPAFAERFAREARALAKLNHPNIVGVHDFGQTTNYCWFIMEFVDGVNLRQMEQTQRFTPEQAINIIPKICDALQYAHDEGVVHRDIKPGNILIDKKGRVKIADFGLAKLLGKKEGEAHLTQSNIVMGTPHYMAPEQMNNPLTVDHRADIYSLGVVFYEMLTGELPIGRFSPPSQKVQVDVRLDEVVLRTLESEPARRYQQVSDVRSDVESISGLVEKLPPSMRYAMGGEYRSEMTIGDLPLVHIAWGTDAATGKKRIARGIIAIGDIAKGIFAFGGVATGVFAFGGVALGLLAVGGVGIGLISFAGIALGLLFAYGGAAIGGIAMGGMAAGYYAGGGVAFGAHAMGGNESDAAAVNLFRRLSSPWMHWITMALMIPSIILPVFANSFARLNIARKLEGKRKPEEEQALAKLKGPSMALLVSVVLQWVLLVFGGVAMLYFAMFRENQIGFRDPSPAEAFYHRFQFPLIMAASFAGLILMGASALITWGAIRMRYAKSYNFALATAILTILISPANVFGLFAGIWALAVLLQPDVKATFR
ncbi:MAG TPA: serine/threonine-protein kinase [Verrucomicrobiae bacterium]